MFTLTVLDRAGDEVFEEDFNTLREAKQEGERFPGVFLGSSVFIVDTEGCETFVNQGLRWTEL
ncbi:hypothetical protein LCGC14_0382010 [marine sediment metagenome]|uniref:Uncharacterized protein n=1 Tax=marine sediment metagenome TaxID=412755 RepID=A0A0F9T859_9ZZZZ